MTTFYDVVMGDRVVDPGFEFHGVAADVTEDVAVDLDVVSGNVLAMTPERKSFRGRIDDLVKTINDVIDLATAYGGMFEKVMFDYDMMDIIAYLTGKPCIFSRSDFVIEINAAQCNIRVFDSNEITATGGSRTTFLTVVRYPIGWRSDRRFAFVFCADNDRSICGTASHCFKFAPV